MSFKIIALIVLVVGFLLVGTHRLRNIGDDLGEAIKSFRKGLKEEEQQKQDD